MPSAFDHGPRTCTGTGAGTGIATGTGTGTGTVTSKEFASYYSRHIGLDARSRFGP